MMHPEYMNDQQVWFKNKYKECFIGRIRSVSVKFLFVWYVVEYKDPSVLERKDNESKKYLVVKQKDIISRIYD